jgi:hypothetical protein
VSFKSKIEMRLSLAAVLVILVSFKSKSQQIDVNVLDSSSVNSFISKTNVCRQIEAAQKFTPDIAEQKGYGIKLLEALSKNTGYRFYLPVATGGILLTNRQRAEALKEQLYELQKLQECSSK